MVPINLIIISVDIYQDKSTDSPLEYHELISQWSDKHMMYTIFVLQDFFVDELGNREEN